MNEKNTKYLVENHPLLYPKGMYFECGDGWMDLLVGLSDILEKMISTACAKNEIDSDEIPHAVHVKEKYGTLRFYMSALTEEMYKTISEHEKMSRTICEECGKAGTLKTKNNWVKVRCEGCE